MRTVVTIVLVLFVLAAGFWMAIGPSETASTGDEVTAVETTAPAVEGDRVLVYYFHGDVRCATCMKIEALSTEAIESGFAEEIANGRLVWQVVNVDKAENAHFVEDYELYTKSVIVVKTTDGQQTAWKNLPQIWELVGDDEAFIKYVDDEVKAYFGDA